MTDQLLPDKLTDVRARIYMDGALTCIPADGFFLAKAAGSREIDAAWSEDSPLGQLPAAVRFACFMAIPEAELIPSGPPLPPPMKGHGWNDLTRRGLLHYLEAVRRRMPELEEHIAPRISALLNPRIDTAK